MTEYITTEVYEEQGLFSVSILGTIYYYTQNKGETVDDFKIRLQKEFDDNNLNIQVVSCTTKHDKEFNKSYVYPAPDWEF